MHKHVLVVFTVYVPKNSGLERFNPVAREYFPRADFIRVRGEDIPQLVERDGGYGWTGNDLYQDYLSAGKGNTLQRLSFFPWPEEKKPRLCLLGPRERRLDFFAAGLGVNYGAVRIAVADKYENLAWQYFWERGWTPQVLLLSGQVDRRIRAGEADLAIDIVCTEKTIREECLVVYETLFNQSGLVLFKREIGGANLNKKKCVD